jgi:hypothetical protein
LDLPERLEFGETTWEPKGLFEAAWTAGHPRKRSVSWQRFAALGCAPRERPRMLPRIAKDTGLKA